MTRHKKSANSTHTLFQLVGSIMLIFIFDADVNANSEPDKYYLRIAHSATSSSTDLNVTSLGVLSLKGNMVGHADLSYLESDLDGKAAALDFGAGFAFNWHVSPYVSIGATLGYNWDQDKAIAAYFPEIGIVVDFTKTFGMALSGRRYYSLYEEEEDIVMLGLVFRK